MNEMNIDMAYKQMTSQMCHTLGVLSFYTRWVSSLWEKYFHTNSHKNHMLPQALVREVFSHDLHMREIFSRTGSRLLFEQVLSFGLKPNLE